MDAESFLEFASQVTKWKMYPYFDVAHSVLCALHVRDDLGPGALAFSRKHPISCWLSTILVVFAGGMLSAALLGEPPLAPLKNTQQLVIASAVWYLVFYTPFDIGYSIAKFLPVKLVFSVMKEIYRCKKVHDGVLHAAKLYPNAYIIMILIGTLKGNGASFTKIIERLLRGVWTPTSIETLQPSFTTKACIIASVVFVLDIKSDLISAPHAFVYVFVIGFFIYFKVFSSMILGIHEPMLPFENLICAIFFGGIFDYTTKAFKSTKDDKADTKKKD